MKRIILLQQGCVKKDQVTMPMYRTHAISFRLVKIGEIAEFNISKFNFVKNSTDLITHFCFWRAPLIASFTMHESRLQESSFESLI